MFIVWPRYSMDWRSCVNATHRDGARRVASRPMTMQPALSQPAPRVPLLDVDGVRVFADSVQTKSGFYDPKNIDGVEFGPAEVSAARVLRDFVWSLAVAATVTTVLGNPAPAFAGALVLGPIGWWWAGQKHAATIFVRGVRVQLVVTDETTAKRIINAVLQAMASPR